MKATSKFAVFWAFSVYFSSWAISFLPMFEGSPSKHGKIKILGSKTVPSLLRAHKQTLTPDLCWSLEGLWAVNIVMFSIALEVIQSRSREGASRRYFDVAIKIFTKQLIFKLSPAPSLPGPGSGAHGNTKIRAPKPKIKHCQSAGNSAGAVSPLDAGPGVSEAECGAGLLRGGARPRAPEPALSWRRTRGAGTSDT